MLIICDVKAIEETDTVVLTPGTKEKHHVKRVHSLLSVGTGLVWPSRDLTVNEGNAPGNFGEQFDIVWIFTQNCASLRISKEDSRDSPAQDFLAAHGIVWMPAYLARR